MKVCFVGAGSIGRRHIKNWVHLCEKHNVNCEVHLLRATNSCLPEEIKQLVNKQVKEIELLDTSYDVIFITNPTNLHYQTIDQLKYLSKNFFVEKPVFETYAKDLKLLNLPPENKYYVACPLRYTQVLLYAKKIVQKEKVYSARAISSSYLPDWRKGIDYRNTYSAHKNEGGGVLIDLIHEWDYLVDLFGFPNETRMYYGKYSDLEIDSEDLGIYIANYDDKLLEIHLDYLGKYAERKLELRTDQGVYVFDIINARIEKNGKEIGSFNEKPNDKYEKEMENFWNIIFGQTKNNNSLQTAIKVLSVAMGVQKE